MLLGNKSQIVGKTVCSFLKRYHMCASSADKPRFFSEEECWLLLSPLKVVILLVQQSGLLILKSKRPRWREVAARPDGLRHVNPNVLQVLISICRQPTFVKRWQGDENVFLFFFFIGVFSSWDTHFLAPPLIKTWRPKQICCTSQGVKKSRGIWNMVQSLLFSAHFGEAVALQSQNVTSVLTLCVKFLINHYRKTIEPSFNQIGGLAPC